MRDHPLLTIVLSEILFHCSTQTPNQFLFYISNKFDEYIPALQDHYCLQSMYSVKRLESFLDDVLFDIFYYSYWGKEMRLSLNLKILSSGRSSWKSTGRVSSS